MHQSINLIIFFLKTTLENHGHVWAYTHRRHVFSFECVTLLFICCMMVRACWWLVIGKWTTWGDNVCMGGGGVEKRKGKIYFQNQDHRKTWVLSFNLVHLLKHRFQPWSWSTPSRSTSKCFPFSQHEWTNQLINSLPEGKGCVRAGKTLKYVGPRLQGQD